MAQSLKFKVALEAKPDKEITLTAFAFDSRGGLVASAPVDKDGNFVLPIPDEAAKRTRIFLAPTAPQGMPERKPTLDTMKALSAYEPAWTHDPSKAVQELKPIPNSVLTHWPWRFCRVRGKVVKNIVVAGATQQMPVCHARVHICDVDPLIIRIPQWPDPIILRIRDEWLAVVDRPFPPPLPDPPEFEFDPAVVDASPANVADLQHARQKALMLVSLNPQPEPPLPVLSQLTRSRLAINPQPEPPGVSTQATPKAQQAASVMSLPLETRMALNSPSIMAVRDALIKNVALLRPYLCYWRWLWPWLICQEVAVVETDAFGRFDTTISYMYYDQPDLYFWVEFSLGGVWTTVYRPFLVCHTYWDYACGSEVIIPITDPRVPWCGVPSLPGKVVSVQAIGYEISISEIQRESAGAAAGLTTSGEPLGGQLEPHVFFGEDLAASGITHYRWSYRKIGATPWKVMDRRVIRHYAMFVGGTFTYLPFVLGPDPAFPGLNLFQFQKDPPAGSLGWAPIDAREDAASAFFLSHLEDGGNAETAQGSYELKLELFKAAAPGVPVDFTAEGVTLNIATATAPFGAGAVSTRIVPVDPAYLGDPMYDRVFVNSSSHVVGFRLVIHVDNNVCTANIEDVKVGVNAAGPCGFIPYPAGSSAHIQFLARHPYGFGKLRFQVFKGSSGRVEEACAPSPDAAYPDLPKVDTADVNGFQQTVADPFVFANDVAVATLLGGCGKAAFAETLWVYAMATDGWQRLSWLDGRPVPESKAFALEPAP